MDFNKIITNARATMGLSVMGGQLSDSARFDRVGGRRSIGG
jgi:hypothetical protein